MTGSSVISALLPYIPTPIFSLFAEELLIDFQKMVGEHSDENMAHAVFEIMKAYGLVGQVCSLELRVS